MSIEDENALEHYKATMQEVEVDGKRSPSTSSRDGQYQIQMYRCTFFRICTGNAVLFQICTVCLYRDTFLRKIPGTFFGIFFREFQICNLFLSLIFVQTFKSSAFCTHLTHLHKPMIFLCHSIVRACRYVFTSWTLSHA